MTLASLSRQFEALKRRYARVIAAAVLTPVADQITQLWEIALANKQPKPSPLDCVRKVADAGFRLHTFTPFHTYLKDCERYGDFPNAREIINKLFPPTQPVELSAVLPGKF